MSSDEGPPSVDGSLDDADSAVGRELSWVAVLPERDRRLFAEELSRLMAEAAETDDLAPVEQALGNGGSQRRSIRILNSRSGSPGH